MEIPLSFRQRNKEKSREEVRKGGCRSMGGGGTGRSQLLWPEVGSPKQRDGNPDTTSAITSMGNGAEVEEDGDEED